MRSWLRDLVEFLAIVALVAILQSIVVTLS